MYIPTAVVTFSLI
nr:unnamed protein product [Callosobruchus analis]